MPSPLKPVLYQLVVRTFGNTNTTNRTDGPIEVNGCGRFADVNEAALAAIRGLGATHVWLTGCLRQATLTDYPELGLPADPADVVKGRAGSFYAIRDYFDVCPDYAVDPSARLDEFDTLVDRAHAAGLRVLIDFVPNHVARGHRSVVRPDLQFGEGDDQSRFFDLSNHFFYLADPPGQSLRLRKPDHWNPDGVAFTGTYAPEDGGPGRTPRATGNNVASSNLSTTDWYETAKLNYGYNFVDQTGRYDPRPRTWDLMDAVLAYWQARGVDGFRCDFCHYVPAAAWSFLIGRARERVPGTYFVAEAYPFPGSGDPITEMDQLLDAGFDAVYHDASYDRLRMIYQCAGDQDHYDREMVAQPTERRARLVQYLENHDERRLASPIVFGVGPDDTGLGSAEAGYQLAPLQYLYGPGPVLFHNGQEVGEPGAGREGYGGEDGRTTLFDYWSMPEFARWVNGHAYDGGGLDPWQRDLRRYYADLLALCQDPAVRADGYWGLKYFNRPDRFADCPADLYSFARFEPGSGRLLVVVANFRGGAAAEGRIRIPEELADAAGLGDELTVTLRLDRTGARADRVVGCSRPALASEGFPAAIPDQTSHVFEVGGPVSRSAPGDG